MNWKFHSTAWRQNIAMVLTLGLVSGCVSLTAGLPADADQTPEQLEALVAPIALYPDPLLSQILVASTYPLELVQAGQWLQQNSQLQGQALTDAAAQQSWDPSVQALVLFPDVLQRLNSDVSWTTNLGNAFLANQASVMDAIQSMRAKAEQVGKLQSTPQETVSTDQGDIDIEPTDPNVIYVPEYNPVWIWGSPVGYYYPAWSYPPEPFGAWCIWGTGFNMGLYYSGWVGWGGWGWKPGWHDHAVVVNPTFMDHYHYKVGQVGRNSSWVHDPAHRGGVPYANHAVVQRFNAPEAARPEVARPTVSQVQQQFRERAASPEVASERVGNRTVTAYSATNSRSVFAGTEHGSTVRSFSAQGRSSMGGMSRASAPAAAPRGGGGASRGGGGRR